MPDADRHASRVSVRASQDGDTATVTVAGELDISSVESVEQALPEVEPGGRLVLDLRPLTFTDSSGLRLLMQLDLRARADGWMLAVVREAGTVADLLRLTRVADRVRVVDDPGELA